jgi:glycosyltransferase involved in cell wall biosynthesis
MKNKKICIVYDEDNKQKRKIDYSYIFDLAIMLSRREHKVVIISASDSIQKNETLYRTLIEHEIKLINIKDINIYANCDDFTDLNLAQSYKIYKYISVNKFDFIHFIDLRGIGFCTVQAKKNTMQFRDSIISVDLNYNTQYLLNVSKRWSKNAISDIKRIYFEKYVYENSDYLILINHDTLEWCIENNLNINQNIVLNTDKFIEIVDGDYTHIEDETLMLIEKENPLVSVCVSHYNYGKYLPYTLKSIKESTYANYEVIVVDDSSTDTFSIDTFEVLRKEYNFPNWRFYTKKNGGAADTKNYAAQKARGKFLLFVDADNVEFSNTIFDFLYGIYKSKNDCMTSYFYIFTGNEELTKDNVKKTVILPGAIMELTAIENVFGDSNFIVKKEVFDRIDGFPNERNIYEDWAFLIRLCCSGYKQDIVPIPLFGYRRKGESLSKDFNKVESLRTTLKYYYEFIPVHLKTLFDNFIAPRNKII